MIPQQEQIKNASLALNFLLTSPLCASLDTQKKAVRLLTYSTVCRNIRHCSVSALLLPQGVLLRPHRGMWTTFSLRSPTVSPAQQVRQGSISLISLHSVRLLPLHTELSFLKFQVSQLRSLPSVIWR